MPESVPRIRRQPIPDNAALVVRGDVLDEMALRTDATRFHRRFGAWGRYDVSALLAADDTEVEARCETRLERFATVIVYSRRELDRLGIEVVPTFRTPHVTLAHASLDGLVAGLLACERRTLDNPGPVSKHRDLLRGRVA